MGRSGGLQPPYRDVVSFGGLKPLLQKAFSYTYFLFTSIKPFAHLKRLTTRGAVNPDIMFDFRFDKAPHLCAVICDDIT
ncbi:MAG: hypothetical protein GFH27_549289n161 [Chloroflexi bacterium AL-W]|nr:hypothetical protein [Chloroflexi bacterium AL-N1]NOK66894.1 hypothetical protein [Chloroflexi bacterium AL-N10]NOK74814.1 hypothetical protein [Chloroflexi bacterium AL-N5]NOK81496.1 hypothetical protein [Chloroflexi bacterium AL-W]NOK88966.1 hypothetical protein [Chloroflexi bacterium AL-N15]